MKEHPISQERIAGGPAMMGFVLGAALGASVALLLAPAPGYKTRRKLSAAAGHVRRNVNRGIGQVMGRIDSAKTKPRASA